MKKELMNIVMFFVKVVRCIRSSFATKALRMRVNKCGTYVGAARIPHIASTVSLEIGSYCSFNGFTATGWGGGKNRELFPLGFKCEDNAW